MPDTQSTDASHTVTNVNAPSGSSSPYSKLWIPFLNHRSDMQPGVCKNFSDCHIFLFLVCNNDFIINIDFICIVASYKATEDVTSYAT